MLSCHLVLPNCQITGTPTEGIITRFGCPSRLVADNVDAFKATPLVSLCEDYGIQITHSTSYYPQGDGLAESSNKILVRIITKLLEQNKKAWDSKLKFDLWVTW